MSLIGDGTIFIIDSSQRVSGHSSSFQYQINLPKDKDYDRVCVLQAILPKSFYLVSSPTNRFILSENGVETEIAVTPGNYNARSWLTLMANQLTTNSSQGWIYTITFPNSVTEVETGKFTYFVSGNGGIQPKFIFSETTKVDEQFGFSGGSTNTFVGDQLTSVNVVKFQVEDVVFIHSDLAYNNDMSSKTDVLQEIYASSTPNFTNIIFQNTGLCEAYSKQLLSGNNNVYSFNLTDEKENHIHLNGLDCVITILIYKKDNINKLIANTIQNLVR